MEIVRATDIQASKMTALIYGAPGSGKTTLLKDLPGRTLVFDVDRTSGVLRGQENIDIVYVDTLDTWNSWSSLLIEITRSDEIGRYDNICIDNISELERGILAALGRAGKNNGIPCQADYQFMQFKLMNSLRYMRQMNTNIIWTAWEMVSDFTSDDGQIISRAYPQVNGKILNNICGLCNVVGRMTVKPDGTRGVNMTSSDSIYAKNQYDARRGCLQNELIPTDTQRNAQQPVAAQDSTAAQSAVAQPQEPVAGTQPAGISEPVCSSCGAIIQTDGKRTPQQIAEGTLKNAGHILCMECFADWRKNTKERGGVLDALVSGGEISEQNIIDTMKALKVSGKITTDNLGDMTADEWNMVCGAVTIAIDGKAGSDKAC